MEWWPPPRPRVSLAKAFVFLTGRIPRGRGQAPRVTVPQNTCSEANLLELLDRSEELLLQAQSLGPDACFQHPVFGVMNKNQTLRFLRIHNTHHLLIIKDILAA